MAVVDRLQVHVSQLKKELMLVKEDIRYICEHEKKKQLSNMDIVIDQCEKYREQVEKANKDKMNELINEI